MILLDQDWTLCRVKPTPNCQGAIVYQCILLILRSQYSSGVVDTSGVGGATPMHSSGSRWQPSTKRSPPKFSAIMNEYVGGCIEDHCTIGKKRLYNLRVRRLNVFKGGLASSSNLRRFKSRQATK